MAGEHAILSVSGLQISFGEANPFMVVDNVSFQLTRGQTLAIVGESGSGKSLTALALMGLLPPASRVDGNIMLHNIQLHRIGHNDQWQKIRGKEIGMVFQEPMSSLNPVMKIGKQLQEAIVTHTSLSNKDARQMAIEWLGRVQLPNPERLYHRYPHQLSGGQKQRVMIAIALCNHPSVIIADEPTTALDVTVQMEIVKLMQQLQRQTGTAMIFITHDLSLAATIADDVVVLYKGRTVEYNRTGEVFRNPQHPYTRALIACKPSPAYKGKTLPTVHSFLQNDAEPLHTTHVSIPEKKQKEILNVSNLRVSFIEHRNWLGKPLSNYKAVDGVSFTLLEGEVLGLVGESGCGKSTLGRSILGLIPVTEGSIIFNGRNLAAITTNEWRTVRREIQMVFQDPFASLNPRMTVADMLIEPLRVHNIVSPKRFYKEAERLLELVHLPSNSLRRYPHQFSGGQRQRLGIARALAVRPKIMICDESVSALDVSVQAQILNLLKELQLTFNLSYLFISHDLAVVHYLSDRVMVMQAGKIVETGEAKQVLSNPVNEYTRRLIASMP